MKYKDTIFWIQLHHWMAPRWNLNTNRIKPGNFVMKRKFSLMRKWDHLGISHTNPPLWCHKLPPPPPKQEGRISDHWQLPSIGRAHPLFHRWEITVPHGLIWCVCMWGGSGFLSGQVTLASSLWSQEIRNSPSLALGQKLSYLIPMVSLANLINSNTSQCFCLVWHGSWGDHSKAYPTSAAPHSCVTCTMSAPSCPCLSSFPKDGHPLHLLHRVMWISNELCM